MWSYWPSRHRSSGNEAYCEFCEKPTSTMHCFLISDVVIFHILTPAGQTEHFCLQLISALMFLTFQEIFLSISQRSPTDRPRLTFTWVYSLIKRHSVLFRSQTLNIWEKMSRRWPAPKCFDIWDGQVLLWRFTQKIWRYRCETKVMFFKLDISH